MERAERTSLLFDSLTGTAREAPKSYATRTTCRACGDPHLETVLDLGDQYLPRFVKDIDLSLPQAPLELVRCSCGLLQLRHTVDPDLVFREYWYQSSINQTMKAALAEVVKDGTRYHRHGRWLDIGANDGFLLSQVPQSFQRIACEPALNLADKAKKHADLVVSNYFSGEIAAFHEADVITSCAMFYDLDDPKRFVRDIYKCLSPDGVWINQLNDSPTMLQMNDFGAICLPPNGLVMAERGAVPIADIKVGERVLTHRGRYKPVVETMKREFHGNLVKLRAYGFGADTILTDNHPVLVYGEEGNRWIAAGEIKVGDRVGRPVIRKRTDVQTVAMKCGHGRQGMDYEPVALDDDLLTVAGYYLAEGFVHKGASTVKATFTFGLNESEVGLAGDCAERIRRIGFSAHQRKAATSNTVTACGGIARWLKETFGTGSARKDVPAWVVSLPNEKLSALYRGYMAGDGYAYRESYMRASTVSANLARSVSMVAANLGFCASISAQKRPALCVVGGRTVNQRPLWDVLVREKSKKSIKVNNDGEFQWGVIRAVSSVPHDGDVYNISVLDDHSYVTPGMTVHNCHEHLTYWDVLSLDRLYTACGLTIVDISHNQVNGGSMRVTAMKHGTHVNLIGARWVNYLDAVKFGKRVVKWKKNMKQLLDSITSPIWLYGASTKGCVMLQYLDHNQGFVGIADRNPAKFGLHMSGCWVPVVDEATMRREKPEYIFVLPWAFKSEFVERERELLGSGSTLIFPLPQIELVL